MSLSLDTDPEEDQQDYQSLDLNATRATMPLGSGGVTDPWQLQGLRPYGQYFNNLSEYVSPATGQLTIKQKDLVLPGRGLNLVIERIYASPYPPSGALTQGSLDDPYIMTNFGWSWKLNFPWVGNQFLYLEDGTKYQIVWDANDEFINHVGSHFTLKKNTDETYTLVRVTGTEYHFDTEGRLTEIVDTHGNSIIFSYGTDGITTITDTIGRIVTFAYQNEKLASINCEGRTTSYTTSGGILTSVIDSIGRTTQFEYNSSLNGCLLTKIVYPTNTYTEYT